MTTFTKSLFGTALLLLVPLTGPGREPIYDGLGSYTRPITTRQQDAQRYFDQGLAWFHGFNHGAALRSFRQAAEIDPECAMAHWGVALALGPHINLPLVPPDAAEEAVRRLQKAQEFSRACTEVEQALITALARRYEHPQPEDRRPLDQAYADALRQVWRQYPQDPDVGALFAEAMMILRPWDLWTPQGQPQPGTEEIVATLDAVLALHEAHPFANHLYIHALEASPQPERAVAAADRLRELQPGLAHNVHMPSHIDIRNGRWHEAVTANQKAIAAAERFRAIAGPPQGPIYVYNAHNYHMLAYAAMMTGQAELAVQHIQSMVRSLPDDFVKDFAPMVDAYIAMPYEVLLRFGRWDEVLAAPEHPEHLPFARALRHAARAVALAAKGDPAAGRAEQRQYEAAAPLVPEQWTIGPVPVLTILEVVTPMVEGEIRYREGDVNGGLEHLRRAVAAEDALRYFEPPAWFLPVRHALGAALMDAGRFAEAEDVYREDLRRQPENGWSLYGLAASLRARQRNDEAAPIVQRFETIWRHADTRISSSCLCLPGQERSRLTAAR